MSLTLSFDTLAYVKQLRAADVPEKQAEAQAQALRGALDTAFAEQAKAQKQATTQALEQLDTKTEKAIALLRKDMDSGLSLLRKDMDAGMSLLRKDMESLHKDIIIKMGGMFIVAIGVIITALRLLK